MDVATRHTSVNWTSENTLNCYNKPFSTLIIIRNVFLSGKPMISEGSCDIFHSITVFTVFLIK